MRIEIQAPRTIKASETGTFRAILFNDSYEPVAVSRNAFVGPTPSTQGGYPRPPSVEATFGAEDEPLTLQPFTFYGRERTFSGLQPGEVAITASYRPPGQQEISAIEHLRIEPD